MRSLHNLLDKVLGEELLDKIHENSLWFWTLYAWWCNWLGHASKTAGDGWVQVVLQLLETVGGQGSTWKHHPHQLIPTLKQTYLSLCLCPFAQERTPRAEESNLWSIATQFQCRTAKTRVALL